MTSLILAVTLVASLGIVALAQDLGGGGYFSKGSIIGLSRGIELSSSKEEKKEGGGIIYILGGGRSATLGQAKSDEEEAKGGSILYVTGDGKGAGLQEQQEDLEKELFEKLSGIGLSGLRGITLAKKDDERNSESKSIGYTGSDFKTPVDIKREEIVRLKARPEYQYDYRVADAKQKDYKSKYEVRDASKVKGSYSLLEPDDKTIRVVDYTSDNKEGFIAKVSYRKRV